MMRNRSILTLVIALILPSIALAFEGSKGGGGGDPDGLEVATTLGQAQDDLVRHAKDLGLTPEQVSKIKPLEGKILIVVVDHELPATTQGIQQLGAAYSSNGQFNSLLQVNRARWKSIDNAFTRHSLLAHEILVLAGLENTGNYAYSAKYLEFSKNNPQLFRWQSRKEILYPSLLNGDHFLADSTGASDGSPGGYCALVMNCTYTRGGCTVEDAREFFSENSDANGVCIALGFTKAVASSKGDFFNPFGQTRTYNSAGNLIHITNKNRLRIKNRRGDTYCASIDPARRSFVYGGKPEMIYTSVTCE